MADCSQTFFVQLFCVLQLEKHWSLPESEAFENMQFPSDVPLKILIQSSSVLYLHLHFKNAPPPYSFWMNT